MASNHHRIELRVQQSQIQPQQQQRRSLDNDYGITSLMDDSSNSVSSISKIQKIGSSKSSNNSGSSIYDKNYVVPKMKSVITQQQQQQQQQQHFRMIVCGDSGIGKSALVHAIANSNSSNNNTATSLEPIEVFVPNTDICIIDTVGYGAISRAEVVFSHVASYIEAQFEKTNSIFNNSFTTTVTDEEEEEELAEERLKYIICRSNDIFTNVDCCLYLIMGRLKPVDIEYMKSIHMLCNIVPVIIQPDLSLRPEIRMEQRLGVLVTMETNQIQFNYLGYNNYDELISAIKQPMTHPYCPPFILDYSPNKKQQQLFHGLVSLKQAIFQHAYNCLKYDTTEKFMSWRKDRRRRWRRRRNSGGLQQQLLPSTIATETTTIISSSSSTSSPATITNVQDSTDSSLLSTATTSMSLEQQLNKIKISQYLTKRRHTLEREVLIQEKKLQQEFESTLKEKKMQLILKELNNLMLVQQQQQMQKDDKKKKKFEPMIICYANYWIFLSIILLSIVFYLLSK